MSCICTESGVLTCERATGYCAQGCDTCDEIMFTSIAQSMSSACGGNCNCTCGIDDEEDDDDLSIIIDDEDKPRQC